MHTPITEYFWKEGVDPVAEVNEVSMTTDNWKTANNVSRKDFPATSWSWVARQYFQNVRDAGAIGGGNSLGKKVLKQELKAIVREEESVFSNTLKKATLSDIDARKWYLAQEAKISSFIDKSKPLEIQAKQAFSIRNAFRTKARELMKDTKLAEQLMRDEPNMKWEEIVKKYSDQGLTGNNLWEKIIEVSQKSRKSVNESLGVKPKK